MDKHLDTASHFAVLVGIDFYKDAPLRGCVRDVQEIAKYLNRVRPAAQVHTLTATSPSDTISSLPVEDPAFWPTYENFMSKVHQVSSIAKPGDFVHIHYSGHGTKTEPSGDLALDLLGDVQGTGVRYLHGNEFAILLRDLVSKKLQVSVVLDCCFSGGVSRNDSSIRYLDYDVKTDAAYPAAVLQGVDTGARAGHSRYRDVSMQPNWLVDPDGYTILTACGPYERAREIQIAEGRRHGALSYFLLRTFAGSGGIGNRQRHIYHQLCARFKQAWPQQNPMFYGNKDKYFFSHSNSDARAIPIQAVKKGGKFQLQAGRAQGIGEGDEFAIYPSDHMDTASSSIKGSLTATVTHTKAFQSTLEVLNSTIVGTQTWWTAVALTRKRLNEYPIRVTKTIPSRDEWSAALRERSLHAVDEDEHPFAFIVTVEDNRYKLLDESGHGITNIPVMLQAETTSDQVCDVIQHLAKFKMVRNLIKDAPVNPFSESFSIILVTSSGDTHHPGDSVQVDHHHIVTLVAENVGNRELYVYIYDMGPSWQIENILRGSHYVLPPRNGSQTYQGTARKTWKLRMQVPEAMREEGLRHCNDTIMVFVTSQLTSFDSLELPKLNELVKRGASDGVHRRGNEVLSEDWACLCFPIGIHMD
ncbi:putative caspase domain-containing protein [Colletotrichum sublineola]|uniref:Putative caspase domain-containing protein n=1 Tax=Colletotrichum sublineola TaxID=1173701 RepID=A0A066XHH4_COLSU|nr:putative caspase domain-containing protein [Colletotrichum sublineola]